MSASTREAVWFLLSDLFVDNECSEPQLRRIGISLRQTGLPPSEVDRILRREVAPVCGRWMLYPGAIGPWPMFDQESLKERIQKHVESPPRFTLGLWFYPGVRNAWKIVRREMEQAP